MLTLVRPSISKEAHEIEERLKNMVVSHAIQIKEGLAPYLVENEKEIRGKEVIERFLTILEQEMAFSNSLSADACIIDPNTGKVC